MFTYFSRARITCRVCAFGGTFHGDFYGIRVLDFVLQREKKRSKLCVCGGFWGHQLILCCKISGGRKWKLEMVSLVWENADEPYRCVWFADPSCAGRIPLTHPVDRLLCETTCAPAAKQAGAIRNPPPTHTHPPTSERAGHWTLRQVAIFAHLKYTHLANWGRGGLRDWGRTPWCSCGPRRKSRPGSFLWLEEGGGALLAGGCLAVALLLCLKGGRGRICSKLQEADEVLICWVAVSLGPCSQ